MYHRPDTSSYRAGEALSVADILATGVTVEDAYAALPADMRCDCDAELDDQLPWRRPAAVLRELHRTRVGEIVAGRACRSCASGLVPELLTKVCHPSDPERTVMLLDSLLEVAGGTFELVAGSRSLAAVVDEYVDSAERRSCAMPGCTGAPGAREGGIPAFGVSVLGLLASWAYEAGVSRDTESVVERAWAAVLDELRLSGVSLQLTDAELIELAGRDPRVVAAETAVPERWAASDWGSLVRLHAESPTLFEVAAAQGVRPEEMALCVVDVANWLADAATSTLGG